MKSTSVVLTGQMAVRGGAACAYIEPAKRQNAHLEEKKIRNST
jgi:hypothetical protein